MPRHFEQKKKRFKRPETYPSTSSKIFLFEVYQEYHQFSTQTVITRKNNNNIYISKGLKVKVLL